MKKLLSALTISTAVMASAPAMSADLNPWKSCGIGAMVFDDNGTAAAISNVIWDLGTTAVSSNISSQDSCNGKDAKMAAAKFIQTNHASLESDIATGNGEHLAGLADILAVENAEQFAQSMKQSYAQALSQTDFVAMTDTQKAQAIYSMAMKNA